jgi:hypothetical protein
MNAQCSPPTLGQHLKISARLRSLDDAERVFLASSSPVRSVASRCHRRHIFPPDCQSAVVVCTADARGSGRENSNPVTLSASTIFVAFTTTVLRLLLVSISASVFQCAVFSCVLFATAASSLSKASAKSLTPSSVSLSVTSLIEIPARAKSSMVFCAPVTSSVRLLRRCP